MNVSPGRRFMIDLLVGSLMADGGLESALNAAITAEIQVWVISFAVEVPLQVAGLVTSINTRVNVPSVVNCTAPTGMCPPWFCGVPLVFFTFTTLIPPFALLLSLQLFWKKCACVVVTEYTMRILFGIQMQFCFIFAVGKSNLILLPWILVSKIFHNHSGSLCVSYSWFAFLGYWSKKRSTERKRNRWTRSKCIDTS